MIRTDDNAIIRGVVEAQCGATGHGGKGYRKQTLVWEMGVPYAPVF